MPKPFKKDLCAAKTRKEWSLLTHSLKVWRGTKNGKPNQFGYLVILIAAVWFSAVSCTEQVAKTENSADRPAAPISNDANSKDSAKVIETSLAGLRNAIFDDLETRLPDEFCSDQGWVRICFDVTSEICLADIKAFSTTCTIEAKKSYPEDGQTIRCESKADCIDKAAAIGYEIGQKVGSCAGRLFETKHSSLKQTEKCAEYMERVSRDQTTK